jgi:hypothetical protein
MIIYLFTWPVPVLVRNHLVYGWTWIAAKGYPHVDLYAAVHCVPDVYLLIVAVKCSEAFPGRSQTKAVF